MVRSQAGASGGATPAQGSADLHRGHRNVNRCTQRQPMHADLASRLYLIEVERAPSTERLRA